MRNVLIIGTVLILVIAGVALYLFLSRPAPSPGTGPVQFPGSTSTPGTGVGSTDVRTVSTSDGSTIQVRDFTKQSEVQADPNVPGQFDIAGGQYPDKQTAYQIIYQTEGDYFGITLYQEPLSQSRLAAEQQLRQILGLSEDELCRLNYVVAPGPGVNDTYAGKNLGFSFCPGATVLP